MRLLGQFFLHDKISQAQNHLQPTKIKKYAQKTSKRKKVTYSFICVLCFYAFSDFSKNKEKSLNGLKKLVFMSLPVPLN